MADIIKALILELYGNRYIFSVFFLMRTRLGSGLDKKIYKNSNRSRLVSVPIICKEYGMDKLVTT